MYKIILGKSCKKLQKVVKSCKKLLQRRGRSNSTVSKVFALHLANLSSVSRMMGSTLSLGLIGSSIWSPEPHHEWFLLAELGVIPEHWQVWPPNQIKQNQKSCRRLRLLKILSDAKTLQKRHLHFYVLWGTIHCNQDVGTTQIFKNDG